METELGPRRFRYDQKLTAISIADPALASGITPGGHWASLPLLGRPDVLPVHDWGVRKGFRYAYGKHRLPEPEQLARYGLRWKPYRTTAAWYLWRAADFLGGGDW